ncbi:hypothetical protein BJF80_00135 [Serinicoccus sp. CUA-874]|nr:hypothetical protein BJF80_00135 [Serinicoccus sp. CUA-874]
MVEEIRAARSAGLRVGVMHLEALRFMSTRDVPVSDQVTELVRSGEVVWVQPDDEMDIDVLMVRYPPILQYPPRLARAVQARHVLVMANQGPSEPDGSDQRYVVRDVTERTRALFGAPVTWVPQSPTIRRLLIEQDPTVPLTSWDNPGRIDVDHWTIRPSGPPGRGRPVVVGRHSRDDRIKFPPTFAELREGYLFPGGYQVRMLGGQETVARLAAEGGHAEVPADWAVLPTTEGDVRPFLHELDFYLYLDNPDAHEPSGGRCSRQPPAECSPSPTPSIATPSARSWTMPAPGRRRLWSSATWTIPRHTARGWRGRSLSCESASDTTASSSDCVLCCRAGPAPTRRSTRTRWTRRTGRWPSGCRCAVPPTASGQTSSG